MAARWPLLLLLLLAGSLDGNGTATDGSFADDGTASEPPLADPAWPMDFVPREGDLPGFGLSPATEMWPGNPGPEPDWSFAEIWTLGGIVPVDGWHESFGLSRNPSDGIVVDALRFADAAQAAAWTGAHAAAADRCSYYPEIMALRGDVAVVLRGAYEPHDGVAGTGEMAAGLHRAARLLGDRLGVEPMPCQWQGQEERLLTPAPAPDAT